MKQTIHTPYKNYPPNWAIFDKYASVVDPKCFGLFASKGDINRFAARYRVAKCFQGMVFDSIKESTSDGYSAMCRVLLVWSAFEYFLKSINMHQRDIAELFEGYNTNSWIQKIKDVDEDNKIYRFIYKRVNESHKKELDNYFGNNPCNISYLASAIRHLFAHGKLTPNANNSNPKSVINICNVLYCIV